MFQKASKTQSRLRLALIGPSGSRQDLHRPRDRIGGLGKRIAVIDTERGSAGKYAGTFSFDTLQLETFHPQRYIDAIAEAEQAGYDVVIVDSLSHAWIGKDGALDLVDAAATPQQDGQQLQRVAGRYAAPQRDDRRHPPRSTCHVIVTLRTKTEYVVEKDERTGKSVPRKIGLAPVQRDGVEYEMDIVGEIDLDNVLTITKTRCPELAGTVTRRPGADFGKVLAAWLSDGTAPTRSPAGTELSTDSCLSSRFASCSTRLSRTPTCAPCYPASGRSEPQTATRSGSDTLSGGRRSAHAAHRQ